MNLRLVYLLVALSMAAALQISAQNSPDLEKAIADLESKWAAAQKDGKTDIVGPLLADRFITVGTDGKLAHPGRTPRPHETGQLG